MPRLASTTNQGTILIWHSPSPERWGAFAGGFEEADENVWYEEGESEFDLASLPELLVDIRSYFREQEDETQIALRKKLQEDEDIDIFGGIEEGDVPIPHAETKSFLDILRKGVELELK